MKDEEEECHWTSQKQQWKEKDSRPKSSKFWEEMTFNLYSIFYWDLNQVWRCNKDIFTQERCTSLFLTYAYLEGIEECVKQRINQRRGRYKVWKERELQSEVPGWWRKEGAGPQHPTKLKKHLVEMKAEAGGPLRRGGKEMWPQKRN